VGSDATADIRVRPSAAASDGRAELENGTGLGEGAASAVGMTSGGRLVGTSEGNRATSGGCGSSAPGGDERGEDALALFAFGAASGVSNAGTLRRGSGSAAREGLTASGARASARSGAPCAPEGSAGALLDGAEMLMLGSATTDAVPCMGMLGIGLLGIGLLGTALLAPGGGALTRALEPNEKLDSAACGAEAVLSPGGGRLDENAAGSGGAIEPCGGVESNRSLKTS